jgi:hypothetical protein
MLFYIYIAMLPCFRILRRDPRGTGCRGDRNSATIKTIIRGSSLQKPTLKSQVAWLTQIDPCVADVGCRHQDELARVTGVRQDFLVSGSDHIECQKVHIL